MPALTGAAAAGSAINIADKAGVNAAMTADDAAEVYYKVLKKGRDSTKNLI